MRAGRSSTSTADERRRLANQKIAGALLFMAGAAVFMGVITAEALYPGYNTAHNEISDLGATRPPDSVALQPSATIFNSVMIAAGVLILAATASLFAASRRRLPTVPFALLGLGVLGVGIFPGNYGNVHALFALLTFAAGGISAIVAWTVERPPFRYLSVVLGAVTLANLLLYAVLGDANPVAALGMGGVERWVAYPILLWLLGLGGQLMGGRSSY